MTINEELRRRYKKGGSWQVLFDQLATYVNRVTESAVDAVEGAAKLPAKTVSDCFKELAELEVGEFRFGRHGKKTRILWDYSPRSIGEVAQGKSDHLDSYSEEDESGEEPSEDDLKPGKAGKAKSKAIAPAPASSAPLGSYRTIIEVAKAELAAQLGVSAEQIEITIKH